MAPDRAAPGLGSDGLPLVDVGRPVAAAVALVAAAGLVGMTLGISAAYLFGFGGQLVAAVTVITVGQVLAVGAAVYRGRPRA